MPNGLLGTEVRVEIEMKIIMMTIPEVEVGTETIVGLSQGEEKSLGPNLIPGLVLIAIESDVIDVGNMIILLLNGPNTPTDEETDYEDVDPASLQMMTQNYGPVDSEGEVEYLNL